MKKSFLMVTLLVILITAGGCSKDEEKDIFSSGQVTIRGTWGCDLDQGVEATEATDMDRDFKWGIGDTPYMDPKNGASLFLVGTVDLDILKYDTLTGYAYSANRIESSQLPVGSVVAAITNAGRYSKFRIDVNGQDLTITWVTYEL